MTKMLLTFCVLYGIMIYTESFPCPSSSAIEKQSVCGTSWGDATTKCSVCCVLNTDCPANEFCWAGASVCFRSTQSSSTTTVMTTAATITNATTTTQSGTHALVEEIENEIENNDKKKKGFNHIILLYILGAILVVGGCVFVLWLFKSGQKKKEDHVKTFNMAISKQDKIKHSIVNLHHLQSDSSSNNSNKLRSIGKLTPTVSMQSLRGNEDLKDIFDKYVSDEVNKISNNKSEIIDMKYSEQDSPPSVPSNPDVSSNNEANNNDSNNDEPNPYQNVRPQSNPPMPPALKNVNIISVDKSSVNGINMNEGNSDV